MTPRDRAAEEEFEKIRNTSLRLRTWFALFEREREAAGYVVEIIGVILHIPNGSEAKARAYLKGEKREYSSLFRNIPPGYFHSRHIRGRVEEIRLTGSVVNKVQSNMTDILSHPSLGKIQGKLHNGVLQFLGIKYATLNDRFAEPVLARGHGKQEEVLDATKYGCVPCHLKWNWRRLCLIILLCDTN